MSKSALSGELRKFQCHENLVLFLGIYFHLVETADFAFFVPFADFHFWLIRRKKIYEHIQTATFFIFHLDAGPEDLIRKFTLLLNLSANDLIYHTQGSLSITLVMLALKRQQLWQDNIGHLKRYNHFKRAHQTCIHSLELD